MADVKAAVLRILQEADLATLSERGVRDLLAEQFEWSSLEVDQHKAMIKAEIESFLDQLQQDGDEAEPVHGSQVALGKRKVASAPEAEPAAKIARSTNADGDTVFDLSGSRQATVRGRGGKAWLDIREFYKKDGQRLPTKRGIMLTRCQWDTVKDSRSSVAEAACGELAGLCVDLGEKRQLQVREAGKKLAVDIREFYDKDGDLAPGRKGSSLQMEQWEALMAAAADIDQALADLEPAAASQGPAKPAEDVKGEGAGRSSSMPSSTPASTSAAAAAAPAAAACAARQEGDGSGALPIVLSEMLRADVSAYQGKTFIHIREHYEKDGELKPGTKGIALTPEQFQTLKGAAAEIGAALQGQDTSYRLPLSGKRVVRINQYKKSTMVDIREMYEKNGEELPGKKGISLVADQWKALVAGLPALQAALP